MEKLTNTFKAFSEDGQEFTIHEYTNFIDASSFGKEKAFKPGQKELRTSKGDVVNREEKGKYLIVALDLIVTSDSPNAP
jgi:hypothetical protein